MIPDSRTAQRYVQVDIIVKANEKWLVNNIISTFGYSKSAICHRISQEVSGQLVLPFLRASIEGYLKGKTNSVCEK